MHRIYNVERANFEKLQTNEYSMKHVVGMLMELKEDMRLYNYHMKMETVDISETFPLKDLESLEKFMDRTDEEWPRKRKAFHHLLFTTISDKQNRFAGALLQTLFSRDFVSNHKWPSQG